MKNNQDQFRLFISSTFKDLDKERSYLVEWVFPRIRELCDERGVEFFPIDLRWGITEEDGKNGRIISACIDEIDNSRPFFIGLVGDRYGWQPELSDFGQFAEPMLERYPWLKKDLADRLSITEIEMQYGALRQTDTKAAFYIREDKKENFFKRVFHYLTSSDYRHLVRLKASISKNNNVHAGSYTSLEKLGEMVYQDLKSVIDSEFPADKTQQQNNRQERSFRSHLTSYVDLSHYHRQIEEALGKLTANHRFLAIHGLKGSGKSTVLCTFIDQYRKSHNDAEIVYYDIAKVSFEPEIGNVFIGRIVKDGSDPVINFFFTPLGYLSSSTAKERILALDNVEYLPPELHKYFIQLLIRFNDDPNIKIIITHTDYEFNPYYTSDDDLIHSYISIDSLKAEKVEVHGIPREAIPSFVQSYMKRFGKSLSTQQLEQFKIPLYADNPHYLIMALFQLVEFGSYEKIQHEIDYLTESGIFYEYRREKTQKNYMNSISTPVTYTLDNVIGRDLDAEGKKNIANLVFFALFISNRADRGLTEREIIEIFSLNPAQWALLRPQVMLICREQNDEIVFNDTMFDYIQGHISYENIDLTFDKVIQYFAQIPWQYELEEEFASRQYKKFLSETDKTRAKRSFRKAILLPTFLYFGKRYHILQTCFSDPKIRKSIPPFVIQWLERCLQEKLKAQK